MWRRPALSIGVLKELSLIQTLSRLEVGSKMTRKMTIGLAALMMMFSSSFETRGFNC